MSVKTDVIDVISDVLWELKKEDLNRPLWDLDADSLDLIELTTALEEEFKISIEEDKITLKDTPNDIAEFIVKFLG